MMQETLLLPRYAETLQAQRKAAFEQSIAALQHCASVVVDWFRAAWKAIGDALRPVMRTIADIFSRVQRSRAIVRRLSYSKQTRHFLAVKQRGMARRTRHGRRKR